MNVNAQLGYFGMEQFVFLVKPEEYGLSLKINVSVLQIQLGMDLIVDKRFNVRMELFGIYLNTVVNVH